ncbi:MAG: hypothetical protein KAT79_03775 [candidate division Zixibacteria bacterium]|nr:hypothetical protein [candidate division Zixibacteria bacterium]
MNTVLKRFAAFGLVLTAFLVTGCLIISGTFVIVKDFSFTSATGFYHEHIDLTSESEWNDHKDAIDAIDMVGFEFTFINSGAEVTFYVYIDEGDAPTYTNYVDVNANATKILDGLTLPASTTTTLTYAESFAYLTNVTALKKLVKSGTFHAYGVSTGGTSNYTIENGKVIVTFTAHGS